MQESRLWHRVLVVALLSASCTHENGGTGGDDLAAPGEDAGGVSDDDAGDDDAGCVPAITSCSGLCGPVHDACLDKTFQCGGCDNGLVCDLTLHVCMAPSVSCQDVGAECGAARNSCGKRLDCGACAMGQECDPDTNTCVACQPVTCEDLGYECGAAWLGCGPTSNTTNCGNCPSGKTCNPFYHLCEPICTPPAKQTLCDAAKAAKGVECGSISNGCGGLVDCGGCPAGKACGVRGVANRCDPYELPPECVALGKDCGTIPSSCGPEGSTVDCGVCPTGEVCNANNVCGAACAPLTCDAAPLAGKCATQYDDGCKGTVTCGCPSGMVCSTSAPGMLGDCVTAATCASEGATGASGAPCSNGPNPSWPKGDGTDLTCKCTAGGAVCVDGGKVVSGGAQGTCCINTQVCGANECGTSKTNSCTGATITCACGANQHCDNSTHLCAANKTCADYTTGADGQPCSNGTNAMFPKGDGTNLACGCAGGRICITGAAPSPQAGAGMAGICCTDTNACAAGGVTYCGVTRTNACTGADNDCSANCGNGKYCDNTTHTCKALNTCGTYGASGAAGQPCSNGPNASWPKGDGTNLTCMCTGGAAYCKDGGGTGAQVPADGTQGTCCTSTASCAGNVCSYVDCSGKTVSCCGANQFCDGTGHCANKKTCASYTTGAAGQPCNPNQFFDAGDGTLLACNCSTAGNNANNTCVGASPTQAGTCQCTPNQCNGKCSTATTSNGCGGTLDCRCTGGQVCNPQTLTCCTNYACTGGGLPGAECGVAHPSCGSTVTCSCSTAGGYTNNKCVGNLCTCVPEKCDGRVGVYPDGCGSSLNCNG